jgi:hypothetical protein
MPSNILFFERPNLTLILYNVSCIPLMKQDISYASVNHGKYDMYLHFLVS